MTLYLTDQTAPRRSSARAPAASSSAASSIRPGATTHSDAGVTDIARLEPRWRPWRGSTCRCWCTARSPTPEVDVFDREARFIDRVLAPLIERCRGSAYRVRARDARARRSNSCAAPGAGVAATITPQHLLLNRNALFAGGIRPHHYCLPVLKRETDRAACSRRVAGGDPRFFLGTDSAPHERARQGGCLRLRGHLLRPRRHRAVRRDLRRRGHSAATAGVCLRVRCRFLPPAAQRGPDHSCARSPGRRRRAIPTAPGELVPLRAGERIGWRLQGASA